MRGASIAVVALGAAVLGGAFALLVGAAAGWTGGGGTTTVVVRAPAPVVQAQASASASLSSARPLAGNGFDPADLYARRAAGVVTIYSFFGDPTTPDSQDAQGSGFVVSSSGTILTNSHVITNAGAGTDGATRAAGHVYVEFADHDRVPATVVGWDVFDDIGVVRVDPRLHALTPVPLGDSAQVRVGEPVAAIGSPFGNQDSLAVGVVSATDRAIPSLTSRFDVTDAIQTDAAINHGNSGGPLFDARGRVIGLNAQIRSDSGSGEGVGFAIPIDAAKRSLGQLLRTGHVAYAYVGVTTQDLTPSIARHLGYSVRHGALVVKVVPGGPAAQAGLRGETGESFFDGRTIATGGDAIVAVDGEPVESSSDIVRVVGERLSPGDVASVTILRGGKRRTLAVRLGERKPAAG